MILNKHGVFVDYETITVYESGRSSGKIKYGEHDGKFGTSFDIMTPKEGSSSPLTPSDMIYNSKTEAIAVQTNKIVKWFALRGITIKTDKQPELFI